MAAKVLRESYGVVYQERAAFKDTYGGEPGSVFIECMRIIPADQPSKTAFVFSHPVGGGAFLPIMNQLARAGLHVLYVNTHYRGNDSALIMEKCLLDLGAGIRDAKERFGYDTIVLGGWSGGGQKPSGPGAGVVPLIRCARQHLGRLGDSQEKKSSTQDAALDATYDSAGRAAAAATRDSRLSRRQPPTEQTALRSAAPSLTLRPRTTRYSGGPTRSWAYRLAK